jgi:hypothetical protein
MTMHKTTRAFLAHFVGAYLLDPTAHALHKAWREAGYPDLDEPEPGTCWTCRWAYGNTCNEPTPVGWEKCASISEWANRLESPTPPRDYSGPPCPGWEPRP